MRTVTQLLMCIILFSAQAQESTETDLPYQNIPEHPEDYGPGNVIARMIDGLGYRYYWATEGLTDKDLQFAPADEARNLMETLQHIYGLSETIVNAPKGVANERPQDWSALSYVELRTLTLSRLKQASELCRGKRAEDIDKMQVSFKNGEKQFDFPYWNMLNGPLADAIYHTGQVVSFRRASGNPMNPKVNVFTGKTTE
ncbi:hypothetical protein WIW50_18060 [Flavobacteriaceae bacterium 3-367]